MSAMKDSQVGDDWIKEACQRNPVQRVIDPKTGQPNGNILTGPVRLAFCDTLFTPKAAQAGGKEKFGTMALYTPYTDFTILYEEYYKVLGATFPEYYVPDAAGGGAYHGLDSPFHDQAAKIKFGGFTPGLTYINHTSNYMPQVVDPQGNIVTDRAKAYAGAWAILAINAYPYGKNPPQPRKGVAFGLQQVMVIGDDTKLAGGAPDPRVTFAQVNVKPPVVAPAAAFGQAPPGAPPGNPSLYAPNPGQQPAGLGARPPGQPPMGPPPGTPMAPPPLSTDDTDVSDLM